MAELSGSPLTQQLRLALRNQEVLDKIRDVYETAEARGEVSSDEAAKKLAIVEGIEREMAEEEGA